MIIVSKGPHERLAMPKGLSDGGHIILECSSCGKPLVDLWVSKPNDPAKWTVAAECCYCTDGSRSFETEFTGAFHQVGIGRPDPNNPDDPDEEIAVTKVVDIKTEGNVVVFKTVKG